MSNQFKCLIFDTTFNEVNEVIEDNTEEKIVTEDQALNYARYNKYIKKSMTTITYAEGRVTEIEGCYSAVNKGITHLHRRHYYRLEEGLNDK